MITGERNTRAFALRALALAISLESRGRGMRVTRGPTALSRAKRITGLKTNDRAVQIAAVQDLAEKWLSS